jgi:hypothetical protein
MTTATFLLLILSAYGLCFGAMNDKIPLLHHLRKIPLLKDEEGHTFFARMFVCPYCTGFHTGWMVFLAWSALQEATLLSVEAGVGIVLFAFASSAACYWVDTVIQWFEREE